MHIAEHTGLVGREVALTTEAGVIILGAIGAECSRFFYFLNPLVTKPQGEPHRERLVTVKKTEVEELNYPGPEPE